MDAVLKIGGSIFQKSSAEKLWRTLEELIRQFSFIIVPGGGDFANLVRNYYKLYQISDDSAHWMAILCENILGFLILEHLKSAIPVFGISEISAAIKSFKIPIFLPFQYLFEHDPLPHSWEVTSDSIAAYFAETLQAQKLILVKDVDGIYTHDPKKFPEKDVKFLKTIKLSSNVLSTLPTCCIDTYLPHLLRQYQRTCYVVNGFYPERLEKILRNEKAKYTLVEL